MNLDKTSAFRPLLNDAVSVTCLRRSGSTVTTYAGTVSVAVLPGGDPADGGGQARVNGGQYCVVLEDVGYPAPLGPAYGDQLEHTIYGTLTVQSTQRDGTHWTLSCVARMGAQRQ